MIEIVFDKIEKVDDRLSKLAKHHRAQVFLAVGLFYILYKSVAQHDKDIIKIKKAFKELQSKGE